MPTGVITGRQPTTEEKMRGIEVSIGEPKTKVFKVQTPTGIIKVEGPEDATESEVLAAAKKLQQGEDDRARGGFWGKLDAAGRGIASGALMNFDDEIVGAANAIVPLDKLGGQDVKSIWDDDVSFTEAYQHNRDLNRRIDRADERVNPKTRAVGQVGGAIGSFVVGAPVAKAAIEGATAVAPKVAPKVAATLAKPITGNAIIGAGQGAVSGAGASEGENRGKGAATGAVTGAVLGSTIGGAVNVMAPVVGRWVQTMRGKNVTEESLRQLRVALERQGMDVNTPAGRKALEDTLASYGLRGVTIADTGIATRARAGVGLRSPSKAQGAAIEKVRARHAGQGERLEADVLDTVAPRTDVYALDESLLQQRDATALPLRQQALREATDPNAPVTPEEMRRWIDQPQVRSWLMNPDTPQPNLPVRPSSTPRVPEDEVLQRIANLPMAKRARAGAAAQAQSQRELLEAQGLDTSHLPTFPADDAPLDMQALDYMKRWLDDQVNRSFGSTDSATKAEAGQWKQLRDALRERMRSAVPEYGQYLDTYSDVSSMREALEEGQDFLRKPPEVIAAEQAGRGEAAQELYRVGAARSLLDRIRGTTDIASPANKVLHTPRSREQLQATGVDPADAARLETAAAQERELELLNAQLKGAATDERLAARADAEGGGQSIIPVGAGHPLNWLGLAGRKLLGTVSGQHNARVNEELLPRILEQDPAAIAKIIDELEASGNAAFARQVKRAAAARGITVVHSNVVGGPVGIREGDY